MEQAPWKTYVYKVYTYAYKLGVWYARARASVK